MEETPKEVLQALAGYTFLWLGVVWHVVVYFSKLAWRGCRKTWNELRSKGLLLWIRGQFSNVSRKITEYFYSKIRKALLTIVQTQWKKDKNGQVVKDSKKTLSYEYSFGLFVKAVYDKVEEVWIEKIEQGLLDRGIKNFDRSAFPDVPDVPIEGRTLEVAVEEALAKYNPDLSEEAYLSSRPARELPGLANLLEYRELLVDINPRLGTSPTGQIAFSTFIRTLQSKSVFGRFSALFFLITSTDKIVEVIGSAFVQYYDLRYGPDPRNTRERWRGATGPYDPPPVIIANPNADSVSSDALTEEGP